MTRERLERIWGWAFLIVLLVANGILAWGFWRMYIEHFNGFRWPTQ